MAARDYTQRFVDWMTGIGIHRLDLGVQRSDGTWIDQSDLAIGDELERNLRWLRHQNLQGADCYARPARGYEWPIAFMDDLDQESRDWLVDRYAALAIHTSREGGYQLWIATTYPLGEVGRGALQQALLTRMEAGDPGSVSGEHYGRLPGTKNRKRGGQWVNVRRSSTGSGLDPAEFEAEPGAMEGPRIPSGDEGEVADRVPAGHRDQSQSGQEWRMVCDRLERQEDPEAVTSWLANRAERRGKRHPEAYARRTVAKALEQVSPA